MNALLLAYNVDESAVLRLALQRAGCAAMLSTDLVQAIRDWPSHPADLILLAFKEKVPTDRIKGFRAQAEAPLVIVCNPISEDQHIELLEAGADLVVFRPFSARLLITQFRVLLRRALRTPLLNLPSMTVGDLALDPSTRIVQIAQDDFVRLTQLEFRLLYTLMIHAGQVVPNDVLVEHVWGHSGRGDRDLVRGLIKRLRAKIEPEPHNPKFIHTIPGVGYTLQRDQPMQSASD
jgi:DNA-binding response OmpR family regulator